VGWDWVHLVRRPLFDLLYQPRMIDDDECGAAGRTRIGRGNRSTRIKSAPVPLCPPQIPHDLTLARTRGLTAWALARPMTGKCYLYLHGQESIFLPPDSWWFLVLHFYPDSESSTLSEMSMDVYTTARRYNSEYSAVHSHSISTYVCNISHTQI
jgi:hypothetical protein